MNRTIPVVQCFLLTLAVGCSNGPVEVAKTPRPVEYILLTSDAPRSSQQVAGSVSAWKTEQIGFEVPGRVRWVREPGGDIEGRARSSDGTTVFEGTLLAQLETERYELAVAGAKAKVEIAKIRYEATKIGVEDALHPPALPLPLLR